MVYIIQTNTSIDTEGNPRDFQSMVFEYSSWDDYKDDILNKASNGDIVRGTMYGCIRPRGSTIDEVIINDEFHLEYTISNYAERKTNVKAYKVEEYNIKKVVCN